MRGRRNEQERRSHRLSGASAAWRLPGLAASQRIYVEAASGVVVQVLFPGVQPLQRGACRAWGWGPRTAAKIHQVTVHRGL